MMRLVFRLLTSGVVLLSASACNGNFPLDGGFSGDSTDTITEIEVRLPQLSVLPSTPRQNSGPITTALALSVQTGSESSQTFYAQYDKAAATWVANVKIPPGNSTEFILTWSEKVRDQSLKLAQATKIVDMPLDGAQLNLDISSDEYNLSFDADEDGLTNLNEITNSTNPLDSSDPLAKVEINVKLVIPGNLADIDNLATVLPTAFFNGGELTMSFNSNADEQNNEQKKPVSDAEFDRVLRNFDALSQAIENKDVDALDRLATSSEQSEVFKKLIENNYDRIEVSIDNIRLRNIDKSIMATLQVDSLIRPNGDRGTLSEKYASRTITSRRVNGDWSKIEW